MHILMIQPGMPLYLSDRIAALSRRPDVKITVATASISQIGRRDEAHPLHAGSGGIDWIPLWNGLLEDIRPWKLFGSIRDLVGRLQPDILYTGGYLPPYLAWALAHAKLNGIPTVMFWASTAYEPRSDSMAKEFARRIILGLTDSVLVPGIRAGEHAVACGASPEKLRFVGNPVRNEWYEIESEKYRRMPGTSWLTALGLPVEPYLLFVGRFLDVKNLDRLVEAYAAADNRQAMPPLVCVGETSGRQSEAVQRLCALAKAKGVAHKVHFPGYFDSTKLAAAYAGAKALVLPSLSETWGLVVNEAMACGVPAVVSNRCGCTPDLIEDGTTGKIVDPLDVNDMASGLAWARDARIDDSTRASIRRKAAFHNIERFVDGFLDGCRIAVKRHHQT